MARFLIIVFAATTVLSAAAFCDRAEAMTPARLSAIGSSDAALHRVVVVCGTNGCAPVQTSAPRRRKPHR